ncbi:MAG: hypothetical protein CL933_17090 [Deltaproteobacteria bacterium]|nr:hypothetical protein [Deltaproteobacteria bacterium]
MRRTEGQARAVVSQFAGSLLDRRGAVELTGFIHLPSADGEVHRGQTRAVVGVALSLDPERRREWRG